MFFICSYFHYYYYLKWLFRFCCIFNEGGTIMAYVFFRKIEANDVYYFAKCNIDGKKDLFK